MSTKIDWKPDEVDTIARWVDAQVEQSKNLIQLLKELPHLNEEGKENTELMIDQEETSVKDLLVRKKLFFAEYAKHLLDSRKS